MTEHTAENDALRCSGCGYTKYGHFMAIERMVASAHEWTPRVTPPAVPSSGVGSS